MTLSSGFSLSFVWLGRIRSLFNKRGTNATRVRGVESGGIDGWSQHSSVVVAGELSKWP
jgi:hypothetical protein